VDAGMKCPSAADKLSICAGFPEVLSTANKNSSYSHNRCATVEKKREIVLSQKDKKSKAAIKLQSLIYLHMERQEDCGSLTA